MVDLFEKRIDWDISISSRQKVKPYEPKKFDFHDEQKENDVEDAEHNLQKWLESSNERTYDKSDKWEEKSKRDPMSIILEEELKTAGKRHTPEDVAEARKKWEEGRGKTKMEADEKNEKKNEELRRIDKLKDTVGEEIGGRWRSYREIDDELKRRVDFVTDSRTETRGRRATPREKYNFIQEDGNRPKATEHEKKLAQLYKQLLEAKHRLEEQYPDLKRKITFFKYNISGKDIEDWMETDNRNPDYDL